MKNTYVCKILYICKTKQHRVAIDVFVKTQNLMSLRGKRDFRLTWQSRVSAHIYKGAFQQISTSRNLTSMSRVVYDTKFTSTMTLLKVIASRDDSFFTFVTLDLLQINNNTIHKIIYRLVRLRRF